MPVRSPASRVKPVRPVAGTGNGALLKPSCCCQSREYIGSARAQPIDKPISKRLARACLFGRRASPNWVALLKMHWRVRAVLLHGGGRSGVNACLGYPSKPADARSKTYVI